MESLESDSDILVLTSAHTHSLLTCTHRLSEATLNNQSITSSCFLSHFAIVFGLSDGDVVYLRMASEGRGGGQSVSVETVMRCTGVVQSLWSGLVGSSPEGITPRVMVISGKSEGWAQKIKVLRLPRLISIQHMHSIFLPFLPTYGAVI